jgi:hypothetical protein
MNKILALATLALIAGPAAAQDSASNIPGFAVKGEGSWELICHVVARGEEQPAIVLNARRSSYYNPALLHADCGSTSSASSDLAVSIIGAKKCPFKGGSSDACSTSIQKGHPVQFEFSAKSTR